jgi:hypothetical protein
MKESNVLKKVLGLPKVGIFISSFFGVGGGGRASVLFDSWVSAGGVSSVGACGVSSGLSFKEVDEGVLLKTELRALKMSVAREAIFMIISGKSFRLKNGNTTRALEALRQFCAEKRLALISQ